MADAQGAPFQDPFAQAMGGAAPPAAQAQIKQDSSALDPKSLGAKTLQSATFGFGADAVGAFDKDAGKKIRTLSDQYDRNHPMAAFGIDLATGIAESMATGGMGAGGLAAKIGLSNPFVRQAATGAVSGAAMGAGGGGDMATRAKHAGEGAVTGALTAGALGTVGKAVGGVIDRTGIANQAGKAFDTIKAALAKDGMTVEQATAKLKADPSLRLADISPSAGDAVRKASKTSENAARQTRDVATADQAAQTERLTQQTQPFMPVKQKLIDGLDAATKEKDRLYDATRNEIVPITPELKDLLKNKTIAPFLKDAATDFQSSKEAGRLTGLPAFKQGTHVPTLALDMLQRKVGDAMEAVGTGNEAYGTLMALRTKINNLAGSPNLSQAQNAALKVGAAHDAQIWGGKFSKGLNGADIDAFRQMDPVAKQYARLGVVSGLEDYVREHTRMPESALNRLADQMNHPDMKEVLGPAIANRVKKSFATEAARARTTSEMVGSASKAAEFEGENVSRMAAHGANVVGGHAVGTAARLLASVGMSAEQAKNVITLAGSAGGLAKLEKAGLSRTVIDRLRKAMNTGGAASAKAVTNAVQTQSRPIPQVTISGVLPENQHP